MDDSRSNENNFNFVTPNMYHNSSYI